MRMRGGLNKYGMRIGQIGHVWNVYVRRVGGGGVKILDWMSRG